MILVPLRTQNPPAQAQGLGPVQAGVRVVPVVPVGNLVVSVLVRALDLGPHAPAWSWIRSVEDHCSPNRGTVGTGTRKDAAQVWVQVLAVGPVLALDLVVVPVSDLALVPASAPAWAGIQRWMRAALVALAVAGWRRCRPRHWASAAWGLAYLCTFPPVVGRNPPRPLLARGIPQAEDDRRRIRTGIRTRRNRIQWHHRGPGTCWR